jgi:putative intracellular protease/amidase
MQIAIPLFDDLTALDAIGPYEVLSRLPGAEVVFVGAEARPYVSDNGMLRMHADATLDAVPAPDIVCVPGGVGVRRELDGPIVPWVRAAHASSTWTTSVCTGSLLLGAAGVLNGLRATSHWLSLERLREYGASPTGERVVEQGRARPRRRRSRPSRWSAPRWPNTSAGRPRASPPDGVSPPA